jgi:nucleotide-binding universal stress UspA family protein
MTRPIIICAVDRSDVADPTLARAVALATWREADLHVLHVLPRDMNPVPDPSVDESARTWLEALVLQSPPSSIRIRTDLFRGDPATVIVAAAREQGAALIVLGRRPRRRLRPRFRGSVARAVARAAVCPVLVSPAVEDGRPGNATVHREIVCAVDFSPASGAALHQALTLAQESGGRLHVIHVLDHLPSELLPSGGRAFRFAEEHEAIAASAWARLRAAVPAEALYWCEVREHVVGGIPSRAVSRLAADVKADLLVVGVMPRNIVDEVVSGATLPALLRRADCSVLAVPAAADAVAWPLPVRTDTAVREAELCSPA